MSTNNAAFCQPVQVNQCLTTDHFKFIHTWIQANFKKKAITIILVTVLTLKKKKKVNELAGVFQNTSLFAGTFK